MKFLHRASFTAIAAVAALGLAACGGSTQPSASGSTDGSADGITVYNAQHESMTQGWIDAFTAETGIKVTVRQGSDTEMSNQILAEGAQSPADVFITENSPAMTQVENAGLFADISDTVKEQVPEQYRPSSNKWAGVAARSTVLVYNKDKVAEADLPASLMDLQDPEWKGRWGAAAAGADFQAIVSAMLELKGEDATAAWLQGLKDGAKIYPKNGAAMQAVNQGEVDTAVIYHYYYFGDQAKTGENSGNIGLHYFRNQDPGAFLSLSGAGVLESSAHKEYAMKFVEFITSKAGQETLNSGSDWEYAIDGGVAPREGLEPIEDLDPPAIDPSKLNGPKVVELMTAAGIL
jgi:iron(III) transport system substrate-binding protein